MAACFWVRLPDAAQREPHYGLSGESASVAAAALALVPHTPTHYSSRWGNAGPGLPVRAHGADGPLRPTEGGGERLGGAARDAETIMRLDRLVWSKKSD